MLRKYKALGDFKLRIFVPSVRSKVLARLTDRGGGSRRKAELHCIARRAPRGLPSTLPQELHSAPTPASPRGIV